MSFPLFIASRYLTSRSKRTFISIISVMSVLGVAIGVAALVIVMSVYNGVTREMRDKILGINPHILVMASVPGAFQPPAEETAAEKTEKDAVQGLGQPWVDAVLCVSNVTTVAPYLYAEVLLSTPSGATGLVVRGIDTDPAAGSMSLLGHLEKGTPEDFISSASGTPGMIVGQDALHLATFDC